MAVRRPIWWNATSPPAPNQLVGRGYHLHPDLGGFLYLAVVLDAFSRRIVGWSMATTLATQLVLDALNMALLVRRPLLTDLWDSVRTHTESRMCFRRKQSQSRIYLQIVESHRAGDQVRQRVIATLGRLDELEAGGQLDRLLRSGARFVRQNPVLDTARSGPRTSLRKQPLDLASAHLLGIPPMPPIGRPRRLLLELPLPGTALVRMHLVAAAQDRNRRLFPQRLRQDFRLQGRVDLPSRSFAHDRSALPTE